MKGLTSHVLDTLRGLPAVSVRLELWLWTTVSGKQKAHFLSEALTDQDGRCKLADELEVASYEIRFHIGEYFKKSQTKLPEPAFLDIISVRFSVADAARHYHIPLVASPWSYTTYKGGAPAVQH
jgi:hydroxyisourate hydrolase